MSGLFGVPRVEEKVEISVGSVLDYNVDVGAPFGSKGKPILVQEEGTGVAVPPLRNAQGELIVTNATPQMLALIDDPAKDLKIQTGWYKPTADLQIFSGGGYVEQTSASLRSVVSTDDHDAAGDIGVRKIKIEFINELGLLDEEFLTLTGQVPVNTTKQIKNINNIFAVEWGSENKAKGTIKVMTDINGLGVQFAAIPKDFLDDASCKFFLPTDKQGVLHSLYVASEEKGLVFLEAYQDVGGGYTLRRRIMHWWLRTGQVIDVQFNYRIPAGGSIQVWIDPDAGGKDWTCNLVGWLEAP